MVGREDPWAGFYDVFVNNREMRIRDGGVFLFRGNGLIVCGSRRFLFISINLPRESLLHVKRGIRSRLWETDG